MSSREYPHGVDCVWLALDGAGHVGAFVTGGIGPVPLLALNDEFLPVEEIEEAIFSLPKVSDVRLLVSMKRPDDFVAMAERGLFVYDWRDVHRIAKACTDCYELIAAPHNPIKVSDISQLLGRNLGRIVFLGIEFSDELPLDICSHTKCCFGSTKE